MLTLIPMLASTAAITVVGTLIRGVLRRYKLAARPATSRHTPPPMAMMGSLRLSKEIQMCSAAL